MKSKIIAIMIAVLLAMLISGCLENSEVSEINSQESSQEKSVPVATMSVMDTGERMALTEKETEEKLTLIKSSEFTFNNEDNVITRERRFEKGMKII